MVRCTSCSKEWPEGYRMCPDDGTSLGGHVRQPTAAGAMPEPAEGGSDLQNGLMVGEYQVSGKLGEGGMGAVYSALHPLIGKKAAIKVISPALCTDATAVERFVQEARSVNQIGHPNIVDVFAFGVLEDGRCYFVMEWLQGQSLGERMAKGRLELGQTVEILDQVCDALEAAHEKEIVHRDLKPDNVHLMTVRGNRQIVKLLDFGIAKLAGSGDLRVQKTRTGMMMGTPGYISPEQARGKHVDYRTDIYALGAMMFEMILGRLPFEGETAMDIVLKHIIEAPPQPSAIWPEIPPALETILLRMLDKEPANRPSLAEVRATLSDLHGSLASHSGPQGFRPRLATPTSGVAIRPTPPPGTLSTPALASVSPVAATSAASSVVAAPVSTPPSRDEDFAPAPAGSSRKKLVLALAAVLAIGGVIALVVVGGGKSTSKSAAAPLEAVQPDPKGAKIDAVEPDPGKPDPAQPDPAQPDPTKPEVKDPVGVAPAPGTIVVTINVDDAEISLDGKVIATAASEATITVNDAGEHELTVTARGRKPYTKKLSVASGATVKVPVRLERDKGGGKKPPPDTSMTPLKDPPPKDPPKKDPTGDYTLDPFGQKKK